MSRQHTTKKLWLNKQTIAHLESRHMQDVRAGEAVVPIDTKPSQNDTCLCNSRQLCSEESCNVINL